MSINKNAELLPYYEKAKELLNYDPETGIMEWKSRRGQHSFRGLEVKSITSGYKRVSINLNGLNRSIYAHRLAWFFVYGEIPDIIDHINTERGDNRITNLRSCNNQENSLNRSKQLNNTSGYKGVDWCKRREKWRAKICYKKKSHHLGYFDCPKEASKAYEREANILFGDFNYNRKTKRKLQKVKNNEQ